jgi:hypothetical protein
VATVYMLQLLSRYRSRNLGLPDPLAPGVGKNPGAAEAGGGVADAPSVEAGSSPVQAAPPEAPSAAGSRGGDGHGSLPAAADAPAADASQPGSGDPAGPPEGPTADA